jgi:TfoX/Sxy family transcriptional regulator of competence genes
VAVRHLRRADDGRLLAPRWICSGIRRSCHRLPYHGTIAYDEDLADRIRELVLGELELSEKKMFGGLAFLIGGNMAVAASGQGGILVRVDLATSEKLIATTRARPMEMRGRQMQGWLRVGSEHLRTKRQLARWVELGTTYARSLPAKR